MSKRSRSRSRTPSPVRPRTSTPSTAGMPQERNKILHWEQDYAEVMHCELPPHRETLSFASYEDYEVHYLQAHVNRCSECSKNFPTGHFLNLHIEENHDALAAARRARGEKTYGCFIEDCERKCSTPQKRRLHLIDKHMFPRMRFKGYNFYIVNDGLDRQTSLLRPLNSSRRRLSTASVSSTHEGRLRRRSSASQSNPPATIPQEEKDDMEIVELERSMSALRFVPASVARNCAKAPPKVPKSAGDS
ncbi:hypothetical protein N7532_006770 [Penicillium argentinense]|uniref:C2H2-type domain-containing protein n=1 Tax=Penicillium argentinense TaxID=1131581 RepID=A0A9W9FGM3_9EURO|nr:uncharacterized protein N7532_006770 [Penicillium argentinense]KAJ5099769.1 hypothetical protein N7532_006770 [Penicillium argentinense]